MKAKVFHRFSDVPLDDWVSLTRNASLAYSPAFLEVLEESRLNDFDFKYVIAYSDTSIPIATACCYITTTDLAIFAATRLRSTLNRIRRFWPSFLRLRMLECGSPITLNTAMVLHKDEDVTTAVQTIEQALAEISLREHTFMTVVRDFFGPVDRIFPRIKTAGYTSAHGLPVAMLEINWRSSDEYLQNMKSYYRSKIKRHLKQADWRNVDFVVQDDFAVLAEQLCEQWMTVHERATDYQREVLTPRFYRLFSNKLGSASKVILFYRGEELIAHALLLADHNTLHWMFTGKKTPGNDSLYFLVAFRVIEFAIENRFDEVNMGTTTYSIKKDLGAQLEENRMMLKSRHVIVNPFIQVAYPLLNSVPEVRQRSVFKEIEV